MTKTVMCSTALACICQVYGLLSINTISLFGVSAAIEYLVQNSLPWTCAQLSMQPFHTQVLLS